MSALTIPVLLQSSRIRCAGVAYVITNRVNGKRYVGITTKPRSRWGEHKRWARLDSPGDGCCPVLREAMRKYGVDNFRFEVVASSATWDGLLALERVLIRQYDSHVSGGRGYNLTQGGEGMLGFTFSAASRAKMSASAFRRGPPTPMTPEGKARMVAAHLGKKKGEVTVAKMRAAKIGRSLPEAHKDAIAAALAGRPKSEAHKAKLRRVRRPDTSARSRARWAAFRAANA